VVGLYPEREPEEFGRPPVGDGQMVYWETVGDPAGVPLVYLHGGPGSGSSTRARRYFEPGRFRAVLFDQRGCGRSEPITDTPAVDLSVNTTDHLVADIERLREHLQIERWIVLGVSWGVTLGLVYAQRHPDRVLAMVLGAVTTGTWREIDWITRQMGRIFPGAWEQFISGVPIDDRGGDLAGAYARRLASRDPAVREDAAQRWCAWEDTHVSLLPGWTPDARYLDPTFRMVFARLVTHYWSHGCFLTDDQILSDMSRLADIPGVLIHGRYDVSSPLDTAWRLHNAWPASTLNVLDDAGHGGLGFTEELVSSLARLGRRAGTMGD
jgi:proline iminopeptidase